MNVAGPVFSVATPTRNALDKLKRCVGSVRGQARLALEHLVQDRCCVQDARQPCPMQLRWPAVPLARQRMAAKTCVSAKSKTHFVAPSRWMAAVARHSPVQWSAGLITLSIFGSVKRSTVKMHGLAVLSVGQLHDAESIAALYSSSDVFVAPAFKTTCPTPSRRPPHAVFRPLPSTSAAFQILSSTAFADGWLPQAIPLDWLGLRCWPSATRNCAWQQATLPGDRPN